MGLEVPGAEPVRVLLIADDARSALVIAEGLRMQWREGLVIAHSERLVDATQELLTHGATCVVLDVSLRDVDPLAAIQQLSTADPDVAIIALAERFDADQAIGAIAHGAQDYLLKPDLYPALLARAIRYAVERKRGQVRLVRQALHDPLTGLPNRALFLDRLGVALDRSRRTNASVAVLFLDVDSFKEINDSLGHGAGDRLLAGLAERLGTMLRPMDTIARFGGDEFTLLFEDLASEREVLLIADRISRAASAPIALEGTSASVTVSTGISIVTDPASAPEAVIREADLAMYRAKALGPSRCELFDSDSRRRAMERLELESELRRAVERDELRVHYQPKISLTSDAGVVGFEALVRWEHPERGLLAPAEFIPLAEETGIVQQIDEFVLRQAIGQTARWRETKPGLTVSVNVSSHELADSSLLSTLRGALQSTGIDPDALCLDIHESALTTQPEATIRALHGLGETGVHLALDDYGRGPSPLSTLRRLPVDTLNIDQSVIGGLDADPQEAALLGAVVEFGHALGLTVNAEGVETDSQLAQLRAAGCDGAQGFLFSPAVPCEQADALLAAG